MKLFFLAKIMKNRASRSIYIMTQSKQFILRIFVQWNEKIFHQIIRKQHQKKEFQFRSVSRY